MLTNAEKILLFGSSNARLPSVVSNAYLVNEAAGTVLQDVRRQKNISTTTGGGTIAWTAGGWLQLTAGWFKTPSLTARSQVILYRVPEGHATGYLGCSPAGRAIGPSDVGAVATNTDIRIASGWGIHQASRRATGPANYEMNAGGWTLVCQTVSSTETGTWVIGAANTAGAGIIGSAEIAGIAYCSAQPTDQELRQILDYFRAKSTPRGIYLTPYDCPTKAELLVLTGESTAEGTKLLSALSAGEKSTAFPSTKIVARNAVSAANTFGGMATLSFATGSENNNPPSTNTKFGMEWGIGVAQNARSGVSKELHILKAAQGSTFLLPGGSAGAVTTTQDWTNASGGTTAIAASVSRNTGTLATSGLYFQLEQRNVYKAEQLARNSGIGYTVVAIVEAEGLNDAYVGDAAVTDSAMYQALLQTRHDKRKSDFGLNQIQTVLIKPHLPSGGLGGGDADYPNNATGQNRLDALTFIRTACDDFGIANSLEVTVLDGGSYGLDTPGDYVHPSKQGYEDMGQAAHGAIAFGFQVSPRA